MHGTVRKSERRIFHPNPPGGFLIPPRREPPTGPKQANVRSGREKGNGKGNGKGKEKEKDEYGEEDLADAHQPVPEPPPKRGKT